MVKTSAAVAQRIFNMFSKSTIFNPSSDIILESMDCFDILTILPSSIRTFELVGNMLGFRIVRVAFHIASSIISCIRTFESLHLKEVRHTVKVQTGVEPERELRLPLASQ